MPDDLDGADVDLPQLDRVSSILSRIDGSDLELLAPPPGLWDRIAAAVAAERAPAAPGAGTVVEYAIDAHDVVIGVGGEWSAFAHDNHAPELDELPGDRTLWSYFDSDEVRDVWRLLITRVRADGAEVVVPLRCDAPHMRRWFDMTVAPGPDGEVRFRSVLSFEEPRPAVALLDGLVDRDPGKPAVPVCSWCGEGHDGAAWRPIEDVVADLRLLEDALPAVDYGICPSCRERMSSELLTPTTAEGSTPGHDRGTPPAPPADGHR